MTVADIARFLEEIAPLHLQETYDNAGLLVGQSDMPLTGVLTCLDATEEVITEAIHRDCNLVVAHHPIIFGGLSRITGQHYTERAIIKAIRHHIAIYAIHTNLDNVLTNGVNERLAKQLGLKQYRILSPNENPETGSGLIGRIDPSLDIKGFFQYVKHRLELKTLKYTRPVASEVNKVALCGGSGKFLLPLAIQEEADVFISADFKYHEYFEANDQITIIDIGHYESEKYTIDLLVDLIKGKFSNFAAYCSNVNTNPINYI